MNIPLEKIKLKNKILIVVLSGVFLIASVCYVWYIFCAPNTNFEGDFEEVLIPTGSNYAKMMTQVSPHLKQTDNFEKVADWNDYPQHIKAGRFIIRKGMNNRQIVSELRYCNKPVRVTFNNLQTLQALAGNISRQIEPDSATVIEAILDSNFLAKHQFNQDNCLGLFIPNTYEFFWNTSAEAFKDRMFSEYQRFWTQDRLSKLDTLGMSKLEVITLASIVQKESLKKDEQRRLSGVYINRLKKYMPLQADPTVVYALKKQCNNFDLAIRRVLFKDLRIKSPYNTYKNKGLPPGPIVTPDIHVIDAVLDYEHHDYIFFIADHEHYGYHIFSETLRKHNANKRKYVAWLNKKGIKR